MEKDIEYWVNLSRYDIKTAEAMLACRRYLYVLFTCQQAVEKMMKALVTKKTNQFPPKTHDLLRLSDLAEIDIDEQRKEFLARLSYYYIETRYPEEVVKISKDINRKTAFEYMERTKELLKWLRLKLK